MCLSEGRVPVSADGWRYMDLNFERGDADSPRGHAVVYYRDPADPGKVAATYVIVLPVSVDFSKYMPPFLAGQVPNLGDKAITAFAFAESWR